MPNYNSLEYLMNKDEAEEFRDVPGFPGYRISNMGRLQTCRTVVGLGRGTRAAIGTTWRDMSPSVNGKHGHMQASLRLNAKVHYRGVHRLVLEAFVGPCPPGMECRHLNGNARDNRLDNLVWGTRRENRLDAIRHGTMPQIGKGERHTSAKLKDREVMEIKRMLAEGRRGCELAKRFNVSQATICDIKMGRRWSHIQPELTSI